MELRYEGTFLPQDFLLANRLIYSVPSLSHLLKNVYWKDRPKKIFSVGTLVCSLVAAWLAYAAWPEFTWLAVIALVILALPLVTLTFLWIVVYLVGEYRNRRNCPEEGVSVSAVITDQSFVSQIVSGNSVNASNKTRLWTDFRSFKENGEYFVLQFDPSQPWAIIPKRFLSDPKGEKLHDFLENLPQLVNAP